LECINKFNEHPRCYISDKYSQWEHNCSMRTDRQTDRQTGRFSIVDALYRNL